MIRQIASVGQAVVSTSPHLSKLRNFGISAHVDSGKTTLSERILYYTGRISEIHDIQGSDGVGCKMDFMELERERGITITSAATSCEWNFVNRDSKSDGRVEAKYPEGLPSGSEGRPSGYFGKYGLNLIDTPGHVDFTIEVERSLRVLDGAVLVVCGIKSVQSQTLTVDRQLRRYSVPRLVFVNKLDRGGSDFFKVAADLRGKLQHMVFAPIQIPIGSEQSLEGVIDIVSQVGLVNSGNRGQDILVKPLASLSAQVRDSVGQYRQSLIDSLADLDEEFADIYLKADSSLEISPEEIRSAIKRQTLMNQLAPILCGSAYKNRGVQQLLDSVCRYLPSPTEREYSYQTNGSGASSNSSSPSGASPSSFSGFRLDCTAKKPLMGLAFKIQDFPGVGTVTFLRIYQGKLKKGDSVSCVTATKIASEASSSLNEASSSLNEARSSSGSNSNRPTHSSHRIKTKTFSVKRLLKMHANETKDILEAEAGDIVAVTGLADIETGTTICDPTGSYGSPGSSNSSQCFLESIYVPAPVVSQSLAILSGDVAKVSKALQRFQREDPTFKTRVDGLTKELLISGMGELHLEIYAERLKREFGFNIKTGDPRVQYRETISSKSFFDYTFKRQTGGRGQYAKIIGYIEPISEEEAGQMASPSSNMAFDDSDSDDSSSIDGSSAGSSLEFVSKISGDSIKNSFVVACRKGFLEAARTGFLIGHPCTNLRCVLTDGAEHEVDSSELSFKTAALGAFEQAFEKACPIVIEPVMNVTVYCSKDTQSSIIASLSSRQGQVDAVTALNETDITVTAAVPLRKMFGYISVLRSLTKGHGEFSMEFKEFASMPSADQFALQDTFKHLVPNVEEIIRNR